jgi:hypothetical protein
MKTIELESIWGGATWAGCNQQRMTERQSMTCDQRQKEPVARPGKAHEVELPYGSQATEVTPEDNKLEGSIKTGFVQIDSSPQPAIPAIPEPSQRDCLQIRANEKWSGCLLAFTPSSG